MTEKCGTGSFARICRAFARSDAGGIMMEYIVITSVFTLAVGGFLYTGSDKYSNLFGGPLKDTARSPFYIDSTNMRYTAAPEAERTIQHYGMVGDAYAERIKRSLYAIASPLP